MAYPTAEANIMENHAGMIEAIAKARDMAWNNQAVFAALSEALRRATRTALNHLVDDGLLVGAELCSGNGTVTVVGQVDSCGRDMDVPFVEMGERRMYLRDLPLGYFFRVHGSESDRDLAAADLLRWHATRSGPGEIAIPGARPQPVA